MVTPTIPRGQSVSLFSSCYRAYLANQLLEWAGGKTDYTAGPFTMYLKSLKVTDYSTGNSYKYGDNSGSWQSIEADGGEVNGNSAAQTMTDVGPGPSITATADSGPIPFEGTHRQTTSYTPPNVYPWVPNPSSDGGSRDSPSTDLPGGWQFAGSGHVQPPSRSSMSEHCPQSRFIPSSNFLLKRCLFTTQYTPPSTSVSHHSWPASSSPSGPEPPLPAHQSVFYETDSAEKSNAATAKFERVLIGRDQDYIDTSYIAPTTNTANSMCDARLAFGALSVLISSFLVAV